MLHKSTYLLYRDFKSNSEWNRFRMVKLCSMTSKLLQPPIRLHKIRAMSRLPTLAARTSWVECLNNEGSTTQRLKTKGHPFYNDSEPLGSIAGTSYPTVYSMRVHSGSTIRSGLGAVRHSNECKTATFAPTGGNATPHMLQ